MSRFITFFIVCLLISCGNDKASEISISKTKQNKSIIKKKDLKNLDYIEFSLDQKSKQNISDWLKYIELEEKINELKKADLSYFRSDKEVVETLIEEFGATIPENINTDAVKARVLTVQNMYYKLNSIINLSRSTKTEIKTAITDLFEAFSNLNFQINKKFEKDSQDIDKP